MNRFVPLALLAGISACSRNVSSAGDAAPSADSSPTVTDAWDSAVVLRCAPCPPLSQPGGATAVVPLDTIHASPAEMERSMDGVVRGFRRRPRPPRREFDGGMSRGWNPPEEKHDWSLRVLLRGSAHQSLRSLRRLIGPEARNYSDWTEQVSLVGVDSTGREARFPFALAIEAPAEHTISENATLQDLANLLVSLDGGSTVPRVLIVP